MEPWQEDATKVLTNNWDAEYKSCPQFSEIWKATRGTLNRFYGGNYLATWNAATRNSSHCTGRN